MVWASISSSLQFSARLILKDLGTFRAICKSWQLSSPMSPLQPLLDPPYSHSPYLMQLGNHKCTFFHPMHDNGSYQMDIPELRDAFIVIQSMVGCSSKMDGSAFFIHPFDRIKIKLPSYPCKEEFESISFSSPPTSTNCFVIAIISHGDKFGIIRRGEVAWTLCELIEHFQPIGNGNPVLYKDRCY